MRHRFIFKAQRRDFIAGGLAFGLLAVPGVAQAQATTPPNPKPAPPKAEAGSTILVVGDSMSAEYGLRRGTGWVALLEAQLQKDRHRERIVNASISGDTTSGGRARLGQLLKQHRPKVLVIELGGNDALRGLPIGMTEQNLRAMTEMGQQAGAKVLLVGMQVPPNYGRAYAQDFEAVFAKVAKATQAGLVPFLLAGVADGADPTALFQNDRIHPNESAQPRMLNNVWPTLQQVLKAKP